MGKKTFRITQADFMLANRKAAREEEIQQHGRQITFRSVTQKSKKVYDRKRLKKAGIGCDDLPYLILIRKTNGMTNTSWEKSLPLNLFVSYLPDYEQFREPCEWDDE